MGLAVLVVVAVVAGYTIITFNRLTRLRQLADNAWADIDVQLKRRHDLIPQVVAVVKGHAGYERKTLEDVIAARSRALDAAGPAERARAEDPVEGSLHRIFAIAEAYPDLQALASFGELQRTLTDLENHLQQARRYYNAVVRDHNTKIAQLPSNLVAVAMRLPPREFFGLENAAERAAPLVEVGE